MPAGRKRAVPVRAGYGLPDADKVFLCDLAVRGPFLSLRRRCSTRASTSKSLRGRRAGPHGLVQPRPEREAIVSQLARVAVLPQRRGPRQESQFCERVRCAGTALGCALWYSPILAKDLLLAARVLRFRAPDESMRASYNWE